MNKIIRKYAVGVAAVAVALSPVAVAPAAFAAGEPISVTYSTAYNADAPIDGSYTAYARVGELRNDLQLSYTIEEAGVLYPYPQINYTGSFDLANSNDVTYSFSFACAPSSPCGAYQYQVDAMNAYISDPANNLTGRSIETFSEDVKPLIDAFGGNVPVGVIGTVTVNLQSSDYGTGQLEFWLEERDTGNLLSEVGITPLVVTSVELAGSYTSPLCEAFDEYTEGDTTYTPTNGGRDSFAIDATVTSLGDTEHYSQDKPGTAITDDSANIKYSLSSGEADLTEAAAEAAVLAKGAGTYTVVAQYAAEDGFAASPVEGTVTVLPKTDPACFTANTVIPPTTIPPTTTPPTTTTTTTTTTTLPTTGAESSMSGFFLAGGIAAVLAGGALILARRKLAA